MTGWSPKPLQSPQLKRSPGLIAQSTRLGKVTPLQLQLRSMCTKDPSNALGTLRDYITAYVLRGCVGFGQVATKCSWHGHAPFGCENL